MSKAKKQTKNFKGKVLASANAVYGYHVMVPQDIKDWFLNQEIKRVICTVNEDFTWHAALMPKGSGQYFILLNSEIRKKKLLDVGSDVNVSLTEDDSKYGIPLPEEMEELLYQDPEGEKVFHSLTMGKQRSLLHLIGKPKSSQKRLEKALVILEHLKNREGDLDFKILNEDFKNNRWKM